MHGVDVDPVVRPMWTDCRADVNRLPGRCGPDCRADVDPTAGPMWTECRADVDRLPGQCGPTAGLCGPTAGPMWTDSRTHYYNTLL